MKSEDDRWHTPWCLSEIKLAFRTLRSSRSRARMSTLERLKWRIFRATCDLVIMSGDFLTANHSGTNVKGQLVNDISLRWWLYSAWNSIFADAKFLTKRFAKISKKWSLSRPHNATSCCGLSLTGSLRSTHVCIGSRIGKQGGNSPTGKRPRGEEPSSSSPQLQEAGELFKRTVGADNLETQRLLLEANQSNGNAQLIPLGKDSATIGREETERVHCSAAVKLKSNRSVSRGMVGTSRRSVTCCVIRSFLRGNLNSVVIGL